VALIVGIATMVVVIIFTRIDFTWHTCIGTAATMGAGYVSAIFRGWRRQKTR
jgi:hypothetical protein